MIRFGAVRCYRRRKGGKGVRKGVKLQQWQVLKLFAFSFKLLQPCARAFPTAQLQTTCNRSYRQGRLPPQMPGRVLAQVIAVF